LHDGMALAGVFIFGINAATLSRPLYRSLSANSVYPGRNCTLFLFFYAGLKSYHRISWGVYLSGPYIETC
jgi:hypothetical protein